MELPFLNAPITQRPKAVPPAPLHDHLLEYAINRMRPDVAAKLLLGFTIDHLMKQTTQELASVNFELDEPPAGNPHLPSLRREYQNKLAAWKGRSRGNTSDAQPLMSARHAKLERRAIELEAQLHLLREKAEEDGARRAAVWDRIHTEEAGAELEAEEAALRAEWEGEQRAEREQRYQLWRSKKLGLPPPRK